MAKNILAYLVFKFINLNYYRKNTLLYLEDIKIMNILNVFKIYFKKK